MKLLRESIMHGRAVSAVHFTLILKLAVFLGWPQENMSHT